jgi:signal transduction histidine kinase
MMTAKRVLKRFWAVIGAVSIRTKILGIVLGLVVLMGVTVTIKVRAMLTWTMDTELEEQAASTTRDLAARSTDLLLINNVYALYQLLQETQTNNANVRYAFIVNSQGQVLAHTFGNGFPDGLISANTTDSTAHHHTVVLKTDEGLIWDTAVPVFGERAGIARVGLSEVRIRRAVDAVTGQMLLTTVFVSLIGITAAALLTWALTRPILHLVHATQSVGHGDFSHRVPRWANDEIGDLADAFNVMIAELSKADGERAEREQLRIQYVNRVIAAQEEERKRISRELHDSTSQSLTSLLLGLRTLSDGCDQPDIQQRAEDLRTIAAHTLEEVHALTIQLRPSVLDDLGLPAALDRHIMECRRRYPLNIDLAVQGLDGQRLPAQMETALYRIVQEGLTNVVRHARATTASIFIERRDHTVRVLIEDDGLGFDAVAASKTDGHLGLYSIRERAELLGGSLKVDSEPGRGTSLLIEIPLLPNGVFHV